jgi:polyphosphate kinase
MSKKGKNTLDRPEYYLNRELSWLEFNRRVLLQAQKKTLPLLERLKFLAIFASNLDEFFMIRVAGLRQQARAGIRKPDPSGLTPARQLQEISRRCHELTAEHGQTVRQVLDELRKQGLVLLRREELTPEQKDYVKTCFEQELFPVLTPLSLTELDPCPLLPGLQIYVAIVLEPTGGSSDPSILAVPVPDKIGRAHV